MAATRFLMQVYFTKFKPLKRVQNKIKNHSTNPTKIFKIHTYMHMCVCVCVCEKEKYDSTTQYTGNVEVVQ